MVLVDFGGRYGQLLCKVVDDPEVVEGQLYVGPMEKTREGFLDGLVNVVKI